MSSSKDKLCLATVGMTKSQWMEYFITGVFPTRNLSFAQEVAARSIRNSLTSSITTAVIKLTLSNLDKRLLEGTKSDKKPIGLVNTNT